jgi:hypothetical protein
MQKQIIKLDKRFNIIKKLLQNLLKNQSKNHLN